MSERIDLQIFIASSGELNEERDECIKVITEINKAFPHLHLEPVLFELDTSSGNNPGHKRIQDKINPLVDKSQIVIALFYSRVGIFTLEEFERAKDQDKKLFLYLKEGFFPKTVNDSQIYTEVLQLKEKIEKESEIRYQTFKSNDFNGLLYKDLNKYLKDTYPISDTVEFNTTPISEASENKLNLFPQPKPYFTGREKELAEFNEAIDKGVTFIAIDGPGGIGKTQFISRCIEKYISKEKIIWFECTSTSQLDTLISEAGYPDLLKGDKKTDREKFSAFKDKIEENQFFIFLDNFQETNNNPLFKEFLTFIQEYLLRGCVVVIDRDNIRNIAITPKRIHIEGFKENKLEYAKALINYNYKNEVNITDKELEGLCEELKGYPLAIDFAILLLSEGESPSDIIAKIVEEGEVEKINERLLNAIFSRPDAIQEEKDFIREFSVFIGIVPEQTVKAIISDNLIKVAPKKLQKKNLLFYSNGNYEIHPLVREFCYKELKDKEAVHAKVAQYYIQQRKAELNPALEEQIFYHLICTKQWQRIEKEIILNGEQFILFGQFGLVTQLLDILKNAGINNPIFNILYGDIAEIQGKWDEALDFYNNARLNAEDKKVKATGIIKYGEILHRKGDVKEALKYYKEAYEFSNENNFSKEEARALNDIGLAYMVFGDLKKAEEKFNEGLTIRLKINDQGGIATSLINIASIYSKRGEFDEALKKLHDSLIITEKIGDKSQGANARNHIASIKEVQGKPDDALKLYNISLEIQKNIGDKHGIAYSLINIASINQIKGDYEIAFKNLEESLKISDEIGSKTAKSLSLRKIGHIFELQDKNEEALKKYKDSLTLEESMGEKSGISQAKSCIANILYDKKKFDEAEKIYEESLRINLEIGDKTGIAVTLSNIGLILHEKNKLQEALIKHNESLKISQEIGLRREVATSLTNIGDILKDQGKFDEAIIKIKEGLKISEELENLYVIAVSSLKLGLIYTENKKTHYDLAIKYLLKSLCLFNKLKIQEQSSIAASWLIEIRETRVGIEDFKIMIKEAFQNLAPEIQKHISLQEFLKEPAKRIEPKIGRNDPCNCGSGKKFKHCHGK